MSLSPDTYPYVAGETHNALVEFERSWDLTTVKLKQGIGVIIQSIIVTKTMQISPLIGSWNNAFIAWYYYGKGEAVDLKDWGDLGQRFENASDVQNKVNSFINEQISIVRTAMNCGGNYTYIEPVENRATINVAWDYHLFSVGDASFFREVDCQGGNCNFRFYILDIFEEPINIPNVELPNGTPYRINYEFNRTLSCF